MSDATGSGGATGGSVGARVVGGAILVGLAVLLSLNVVWIARHRDALSGTPVGAAPDFHAPLLDGGETHLTDAQGHVLVLAFWATWCGPCVRELPALERVYRRLSPGGVRFLAVNIDGGGGADEVRPIVRAFRDRFALTLPIALDAAGEMSARYRVDTIPRTVILDGSGQVKRVLDGAHAEEEMQQAIESVQP
jgi:thiol-disulfide isomerase/thioredoxin